MRRLVRFFCINIPSSHTPLRQLADFFQKEKMCNKTFAYYILILYFRNLKKNSYG